MSFIRTTTENEARQLAAKYFADREVQILASQRRTPAGWEECCYLEDVTGRQGVFKSDQIVFLGLGKDAATIEQPPAWTSKPKWQRGLWARAVYKPDGQIAAGFFEWDGLDATPDIEAPDPEGFTSLWFGPLPAIPSGS